MLLLPFTLLVGEESYAISASGSQNQRSTSELFPQILPVACTHRQANTPFSEALLLSRVLGTRRPGIRTEDRTRSLHLERVVCWAYYTIRISARLLVFGLAELLLLRSLKQLGELSLLFISARQ